MYGQHHAIIGAASNLKGGPNPAYTVEDFTRQYPQFFADEALRPPAEIVELYISFAHATVKQSRYHESWQVALGLFIAHFLLLYMTTMVDPEAPASTVIQAGQTRGLTSAKSVDSVSVSYDFSTALNDLDGWAQWKLTTYGVQFATIAKVYNAGGMYVW